LGNLIGFVAAFSTTVAFVPQAMNVYKTKKTDDISFGIFFWVMCVGVALWDVYGFIIGSIPVIMANSMTLLLAVYIFIMKIKLEGEKLILN